MRLYIVCRNNPAQTESWKTCAWKRTLLPIYCHFWIVYIDAMMFSFTKDMVSELFDPFYFITNDLHVWFGRFFPNFQRIGFTTRCHYCNGKFVEFWLIWMHWLGFIKLIECYLMWNSMQNENSTKRNQDTKFVVSSFTQCNIHTRHVLSNRVLWKVFGSTNSLTHTHRDTRRSKSMGTRVALREYALCCQR